MNIGNLDKGWKGFGQAMGYFGIGAAAGALGAGIGAGAGVAAAGGSFGAGFMGTASAAGFGAGFASGFAGGMTSGFITGAGNTWMQGGNFGQGIFNGLNTGFKAGLIGGVTAGIAGGITAKRYGGDFWTGDGMRFASDYPLPGQGSYEQGRKTAEGYMKSTDLLNTNDVMLGDRMGANIDGYELGKYKVDLLTTSPGDELGLTGNGGAFIKPDGGLIGGRTNTTFNANFTVQTQTIRIAPGVAQGNPVDFLAIAGHEWLHAQHYFWYGKAAEIFTEIIARQYSLDVYYRNQRIIPYRPSFWGF
jgi:hypothetical protein